MFYRVNENGLIDCADYKYAQNCLETDITTRADYCENQEKFAINEEGALIDISNTTEYLEQETKKETEKLKQVLIQKINDYDMRRIRAICEPTVKDANTGQTWLEYYTLQVQALREELINLT